MISHNADAPHTFGHRNSVIHIKYWLRVIDLWYYSSGRGLINNASRSGRFNRELQPSDAQSVAVIALAPCDSDAESNLRAAAAAVTAPPRYFAVVTGSSIPLQSKSNVVDCLPCFNELQTVLDDFVVIPTRGCRRYHVT